MPQFKNRDIETGARKNQKSASGIWVSAGEIEHSDHDTTDWMKLQSDFVKMRDGHTLVSTTIDILKYPILMSEWRIEGKNKEVNHYVEFVFKNLVEGFDYLKRHKLLALDFGLAMHEIVIKRGFKFGGKVHNRPVWFAPFQNETINKFLYDENSMFFGVEHEKRIPEGGSEFIEIMKDDLEWFSFNKEFNDIRGRPILRPARFFWDCQMKIVRAKTQGIQRGAGIPALATNGTPGAEDAARIQQIGRTIGQMNEGYIAYDKNKMEVTLLEPHNQEDALPMLEWLDRQIVFNTLSQFLVSGIGQNGSRAATGEHKGAYEMAASVILQALEENFQRLTNRIVSLSAYARIPAIEYPQFHFNAITQADLSKTAKDLTSLFDSRIITKQREDEKFLREMFGLPELQITTDIAKPEDQKRSIFNKGQLSKKKKDRKVSLEVLDHEKKVFSLDSAIEHYEETEAAIEKILDKRFHEFIIDLTEQLKANRKKDLHIRKSILQKFIDDVTSQYEKGFERGERDIETEVKKLTTRKLQLPEKKEKSKKKTIDRLANKLFFNVKTSIENKMDRVSDEFIQGKGGIEEIMLGFETGFKREKDSIKTEAEAGYADGRGKKMDELEGDIETYLYTAVMDAQTCEECAPLDGLPFTREEIKESGLNLDHPVNPNCLGGARDRCHWIPLKIRGDE